MSEIEKFIREQLEWNRTHKIEDENRHEEIMKQITAEFENINQKLNPMAENYFATKKLGKWLIVILSFIAIILTILSNYKNIFK